MLNSIEKTATLAILILQITNPMIRNSGFKGLHVELRLQK